MAQSGLDANLLKLFAARPPLDHKTPVDRPPAERRLPPISGVATFLARAAAEPPHDAKSDNLESRDAIKKRKINERKARAVAALTLAATAWKPNEDPKVTHDPYKTLFVGRLSYAVTEKMLRREFEQFGPIISVRLVASSVDARPRGYAFIEYERERDLTLAYREADGIKIDGRRIVVDVERGRTVKGWKPRRLGGGLGGTRIGGNDVNIKVSGRGDSGVVPSSSSARGGGVGAGGGGYISGGGGGGGSGGGGSRRDERYDDRRPSYRDSGSGGRGGLGYGHEEGRDRDRRGGSGGYDDRRGSGSGNGFDRRGGHDRRRSRSPPSRGYDD
ncbi:hypothetical protein HK100_007218, partial [Physocladia obscura]